MSANAAIFAGLNKKVDLDGERMPRLPPDFVGQLQILGCQHKKERKGAKTFYIVTAKIVKSNGAKHPKPNPKYPTTSEVGATVAWSQNLIEDAAAGSVQAFSAAINGVDRKDPDAMEVIQNTIDTDLFKSLAKKDGGEAQWDGKLVNVETYGKVTNNGYDFTVHMFSPAT